MATIVAHIYEDQLELMRDVQLKREPFEAPSLHINPDFKITRGFRNLGDVG